MSNDSPADDRNASGQIYHRQIEPTVEDANYRLLCLIGDIENTDVSELPPMWERIDDVVTELFQDPPSDAAQLEVEFSYHGYRVMMDQSGTVSLKKLSDEQTL